jgi:hypothetical protein
VVFLCAGDGDTSHLDEAVPMPGSFELVPDAATVGRVAEKADIVIPVATGKNHLLCL